MSNENEIELPEAGIDRKGSLLMVNVGQIEVSDRARKEFKNIDTLADSIKQFGLFNPITITRNPKGSKKPYRLVAGERRYRATCKLFQSEIACHLFEELDPLDQKEIELEENIKRESLTWMERVALTKQIDTLKREKYGHAAQGQAPLRDKEGKEQKPGWDQKKTAELLDISQQKVSQDIKIASKLEERPELKELVQNLPMAAAIKLIENLEEGEKTRAAVESGRLKINHNLTLGDCIEGMKKLPDNSIDLVITDPPYGLEAIEGQRSKGGRLKAYMNALSDSDNMSAEDSLKVLQDAIKEFGRICKPSAHVYIFFPFSLNMQFVYDALEENGFIVQPYPIIWNKVQPENFLGYSYANCYEPIVFAIKEPRGKRLNNPCKAILEFQRVDPRKKFHPFQKPDELLIYLIKQSSHEGQTVLDPFAGSGSTLVAAQLCGRSGIGFELDEKDYNSALKRLSMAQREDTKE